MARGFFNSEKFTRNVPSPKGRNCMTCGLYKTCHSPKMPCTGRGHKGIFVLAEAPGKNEDARNTQLIGEAGQLLRESLSRFGVDLDRDCWKMNAINCRPPGNRKPLAYEIEACRSRVTAAILEHKPSVIIPLGGSALQSLIGLKWVKDTPQITVWRGFQIPDYEYKAHICPTFHPSFVMREEKNKAVKIIFEEDLERAIHRAFTFDKYAWDKDPSDDKRLVRILNEEEAIAELKSVVRECDATSMAAFDYETTGLKPHYKEHRIVTCAICLGDDDVFAFSVDTDAVADELYDFLNSPIRKVAANMKFEETWSRVCLGTPVRGWAWDTMLTAHVEDNRQRITSLKFQACVNFGVYDYDSHLSSFLRPSTSDREKYGANAINRVHQIPRDDLLLYNGLDALYEYRLAVAQQMRMEEAIQTPQD